MRKALIHITLFFLLSLQIRGQSSINFDHISIDKGLSQNTVTAILKDSKGFMWFGTSDGLNRFDGYGFKIFRHQAGENTSLSNNKIFCLMEDQKGRIWIGTSGGINVYEREYDRFVRYLNNPSDPKSLNNNFVRSVFEDKKGNIWVGTLGGGLNLFDETNNNFIHVNTGTINVYSILEDRKGNLWFVSEDKAIHKLERTGFRQRVIPFSKDTKGGHDPARGKSLHEDTEGNIWIATEGDGIYIFNTQKESFEHISQFSSKFRINNNIVQDIYFQGSSDVWIATDGGGINIINKKKSTLTNLVYDINDPHGLSSNAIYQIYPDNEGAIWIGTFGGGINVLNPHKKQFNNFTQAIPGQNGLSHKSVLCFNEDEKGILWIGTDGGGLNRFDRKTGKFHAYLHNPSNSKSISSNVVTSIYQDRKGNLWIGTYNGGLNLFDRQTESFVRYRNNPADTTSILNNNVWKIYEDSENNLWVGTLWGLELFDREKKTFTHIPRTTINHRIFPTKVVSMLEDSMGKIWVGGIGMALFDKKTKKFLPPKSNNKELDNLSNYDIRDIYEGPNNEIWIGTEGGGLYRFNAETGSVKLYTVKNGLPNDAIHQIQPDNRGNLWLSTNMGLSRFDPRKEIFRNFEAIDGLQSNQFSYSASLKTRYGDFLFGGVNGFTVFNPDSIKENFAPPAVFITGFTLFNKPVVIGEKGSVLQKDIIETKQITLRYKSVFTFEFTALNYTSSEKNHYRYRMKGFDDWNNVGTKRTATYTNLDPGKYTFRVQASNNDGIWNNEGASIEITILPPFWKTYWAFIIYTLLLIGLFISFRSYLISIQRHKHQLQIKDLEKAKIEEVNQMKLRFFTNISHEFRTPLTLILGPLEKLIEEKEPTESIKNQLKLIYRNAARMLRLINELMDFRKIETGNMKVNATQGDIVEFLNGIYTAFRDMADRHSIEYRFESNIESLETWFDRDHLDKIFYNLLSNAFKFTSDKGHVVMKLNLSDNHNSNYAGISSKSKRETQFLEVSISDSGIGISLERQQHIFDRFYQLSTPATKGRKMEIAGSGIGLALTKDLIELYNGKISVTSKPGYGSVFTVLLPLGKDQFTSEQLVFNDVHDNQLLDRNDSKVIPWEEFDSDEKDLSPETANLPSKQLEIMIVDDNPDLRIFIKRTLEPRYKVIQAAEGHEALKLAQEVMPNLIITDIMMPGMDGVEFCAKVKGNALTSHIPIIMLTAKTSDESKIEGFKTGADDYMPKPFNPVVLAARVLNLLESRRKLQEKFRNDIIMQPSEVTVTSMDEKFLVKAMEIVEKHIDDSSFDVKVFVNEMGMSRSVLYRKLEALTGQSVNEFMRVIRLKRAAHLLTQKKLNVSEISYEVGFNDPQYFSKCFCRQFGVTPSEYAAKSVKN